MTRVLTRLIPLVMFLGLSHFALEARACTCAPQASVYQEYQLASAVFVGKATGSRDTKVSSQFGNQTVQSTRRIFQFSVSETLKGVKTSQIDISSGVLESSCYSGFNIGETYLVYAFGKGEPFSSGYCSRTDELEDAVSDLHFIRELLRGVPEPRVYGSVTRIETVVEGDTVARRVVPVAGVKMLIEGEGKHFELVTDPQGFYRLENIPDGRYKARPLLPDNQYKFRRWTFEEFTLATRNPDIFSRTAATIDFYLEWNNELTGEILDSEGNQIEHAKVALMLPHEPAPLRIPGHAIYRPDGFGFSGLTPRRYLLSVSIKAPFEDKTSDFYYPGTERLDEAERIEIGIDQTLKKNFRLPKGYVVREINGVIVWPNGVPVSQCRVTLMRSKDSADSDDNYDRTVTDQHGRFSLQTFVGAEYWIVGYCHSGGKGEPIKIKVEMINEPLKIVIPFPTRITP